MYNLQQAGQYLENGVVWPEPRLSDALPGVEDYEALEATLGHLAGAIRWRQQHAHAHRLAGQVYTAREEWLRAAEAYTHAREWAPDNPLLAWESGLIYEQMLRIIEDGPSKTLLPELANGEVEAPDASFESPYCSDVPASCYMGETSFTLPLADLPDGPSITVPTLFLHAPAKVRYPLTLPTGEPALAFMLGLDPTASEWGSDGATFQLWVEPPDGPVTMVYERGVDASVAIKGWVSGWVDLSPWAGEQVVLVLTTTPGPSGDTSADWYGWGDVMLTTAEVAQYIALVPRARLVRLWESADLSAASFLEKGNEARRAERYREAYRWYDRAGRLGNEVSSSVWYTRFLELQEQQDEASTIEALQRAVAGDAGWSSPEDRFRAWFLWGKWLYEQGRIEEAEHAFEVASLIFTPGSVPRLDDQISEVYRFLGLAQTQ
ncbi:MAG: tetratricopeptide repeat protein [Chloroflexota bacterium]|nr:tetratricopeptide repeat protein [Chloroflexota bacterium]